MSGLPQFARKYMYMQAPPWPPPSKSTWQKPIEIPRSEAGARGPQHWNSWWFVCYRCSFLFEAGNKEQLATIFKRVDVCCSFWLLLFMFNPYCPQAWTLRPTTLNLFLGLKVDNTTFVNTRFVIGKIQLVIGGARGGAFDDSRRCEVVPNAGARVQGTRLLWCKLKRV